MGSYHPPPPPSLLPSLLPFLYLGAVVLNVGTTFVPEEKAMVGDVDKRGMEEVTDLLTPSPFVDPGTGEREGGRGGGREAYVLISNDKLIPSLPPSLPPFEQRRGRSVLAAWVP